MKAESKTAKLRAILAQYPPGCRLSHDELRDLAERVGATEEYTRLVVNGSGRPVGTRVYTYTARRFR